MCIRDSIGAERAQVLAGGVRQLHDGGDGGVEVVALDVSRHLLHHAMALTNELLRRAHGRLEMCIRDRPGSRKTGRPGERLTKSLEFLTYLLSVNRHLIPDVYKRQMQFFAMFSTASAVHGASPWKVAASSN